MGLATPRVELAGRAALVTAARRIGAAVALELGAAGLDVAVAYRSRPDEARRLVEALEAGGTRALAAEADLASEAGCRRLVEGVVERFGRLDVLVNVASRYERRPWAALDAASLSADLAVDLDAVLHCSRAAVPHMRLGGFGRIVNFSDWVAVARQPRYRGYVGYYVAKAAVIALTEALALELAADGILVNAVAPGPILPIEGSSEKLQRATLDATPLGRWGGGPEVGHLVRRLVETTFLTGQVVRVDGGRQLA
jgi:NAD(P)-dependent dehydrogenase (short-subunit alcohol dehydrogenase family)